MYSATSGEVATRAPWPATLNFLSNSGDNTHASAGITEPSSKCHAPHGVNVPGATMYPLPSRSSNPCQPAGAAFDNDGQSGGVRQMRFNAPDTDRYRHTPASGYSSSNRLSVSPPAAPFLVSKSPTAKPPVRA